jgi:hypothetical protein
MHPFSEPSCWWWCSAVQYQEAGHTGLSEGEARGLRDKFGKNDINELLTPKHNGEEGARTAHCAAPRTRTRTKGLAGGQRGRDGVGGISRPMGEGV